MASKGRVPKRERDANAPKRPYNAYTIFYKHYLEQFNRKMPNSSLDSRQLTMQIGKAWKSLSDVEKEPFQEKANKEKARYEKELAAYQKSDDFRKFQTREAELRQLRKEIGAVDSEAGPIVDRIGRLQSALEEFEQGELSRREKMLGVWTRKLIPELQAAGLMQELGLTPLSSPAALIAALESACAEEGGSQKRRLHSALARVYLPTTPV